MCHDAIVAFCLLFGDNVATIFTWDLYGLS